MRQEAFEQQHRERWEDFERMLALLEKGADQDGEHDFPVAYRRMCVDLALARSRGFGASLVERLNQLVLQGHQRLYGERVGRLRPIEFLARDFPRAVRAQARTLAAVSLLFYGSAVLVFALDLRDPDLIYAVMSGERVAEFEYMYDPSAEHFGTPRGTVGDFGAFAYYTSNNIGVSLRAFAWGMFAGVGSLFLVAFNGILIGLLGAHLTLAGQGGSFFSFVVGHASFELTAVVLSGTAGLRIGWSVVAPGSRSRLAALREAATALVPVLYGTIALLLMAAVVEAFWSSNRAIPEEVKYGVGGLGWVLVVGWLALGGRQRAH